MYEISKEQLEYIMKLIANKLTWAQANDGMRILQSLKELDNAEAKEPSEGVSRQ